MEIWIQPDCCEVYRAMIKIHGTVGNTSNLWVHNFKFLNASWLP